ARDDARISRSQAGLHRDAAVVTASIASAIGARTGSRRDGSMDHTASIDPSTPVTPPTGVDESGPSIPCEVPRPEVAVIGHYTRPPDPRNRHPCPGVGGVEHERLRIEALGGRLIDVLRAVGHPEPAVLLRKNPLSARRLLRRVGDIGPAVRRWRF